LGPGLHGAGLAVEVDPFALEAERLQGEHREVGPTLLSIFTARPPSRRVVV
jgi:hypothetical protein